MSPPANRFPPPDPLPPLEPLQVLRGAARVLAALGLTLGLLPVFLLVKLAAPSRDRAIIALWARGCLWLSGMRFRVEGRALPGAGAIVANHVSWLDIVALAAAAPVHFVSKAEIASWPGVGWLAKIARTEFIERRPAQARQQKIRLTERVADGQSLCFFPEGTSTDGTVVLPFKSALFSIFEQAEDVAIQPASLIYQAAPGAPFPDRFYGLYDDMDFAPHLWAVMCRSSGGRATVLLHPPIAVHHDRKAMAAESERVVRAGIERVRSQPLRASA